MITVIIPCWRRFKNFEGVIKAWLAQEEVNEVIIFDNSGTFRTNIANVLVLNSSRNLGPQAKFACSVLAKNDIVLYSDDDVLAKPRLVKDLLSEYRIDRMVGIMGKRFTGNTYYKSTGYRGANISKPIKVDYLCGLVMLVGREFGGAVAVRECPTRFMDDWWFQHHFALELIVVPTKNYELLPENLDKSALHLQPEMRPIREKYFRGWVKDA